MRSPSFRSSADSISSGLLFGVSLAALALAAPAGAVDVTTDTTTPANTSTANAGAPDDITITNTGSVVVSGGAAVTVDSDHSVTNDGEIRNDNADDAVGIRVTTGRTGSITNNAVIAVSEDYTPTDADGDGDLDQPIASGARRVGILIEGPSAFTGNVTQASTGSIEVEGNQSAGIRSLAAIDGDVSIAGVIVAEGQDTIGVDLRAVTGDVAIGANVIGRGEGASAVILAGDVGGTATFAGETTATAFRETQRRVSADQRALLDADDLLSSGPAAVIGASIAQGAVITGSGRILTYGDAVALLISAGWDPARASDVILGRVVEAETASDGSTSDVTRDYAVINRGAVQAFGINDGFDATAIVIGGDAGQRTVLDGGLSNEGRIDATSAFGTATGLRIADGGDVAEFNNSGALAVAALSDGDDVARAVVIEAGGLLATLINDGTLEAIITDDDGDAIAIQDSSGTLTLIENAGLISARSQINTLGATSSGERIAIDLSASSVNAVVRQLRRDADDGAPAIVGDVRLGSGDDSLELAAGSLTGDVAFGAGADTFTISGGSTFEGAVSDADGALALNVDDGSFVTANASPLAVTSARFGAESQTTLRVATDGAGGLTAASINASDTIEIVDGATFTPLFSDTRTETFELVLLSAANGVTQTGAGAIANALGGDQPFLYETDLALVSTATGDQVVLSARRRSASELGLNDNQAAAFDPVLAAIGTDEDLSLAIGAITSQSAFFEAYNQVLPDFSGAQLQFARANLDGGIGAVANRLDVVRAGREASAGVWIQEFATYADREGTAQVPGYRGRGFGVAIGADRPLGPFYAVGLNLVGAASQYQDHTTFDEPLSAITAHVGGYAAAQAGPVLLDFYGGLGADLFDSERNVRIGTLERTTTADWNAYHVAGSARAAVERNFAWFYVRPELALDFLSLREEGYRESGAGALDLDVDERTTDMLTSTASLTLGGKFGRDARTWWSPRLRLGYRSGLSGEVPVTTASFLNETDVFTLRAEELPDSGGLIGFSFAAGGEYSSFALDYDADIRDGFEQHIARVAFRFLF